MILERLDTTKPIKRNEARNPQKSERIYQSKKAYLLAAHGWFYEPKGKKDQRKKNNNNNKRTFRSVKIQPNVRIIEEI